MFRKEPMVFAQDESGKISQMQLLVKKKHQRFIIIVSSEIVALINGGSSDPYRSIALDDKKCYFSQHLEQKYDTDTFAFSFIHSFETHSLPC